MTKKDNLLLEHDYDGIQELDNDLPNWWLNLFYITIVFSVMYILYFHVFGGLTQEQEFIREVQIANGEDWVKPQDSELSGVFYNSPFTSSEIEMTPKLQMEFSTYVGEYVTFDQLIREAKQKASPEQLNSLNSGITISEVNVDDADIPNQVSDVNVTSTGSEDDGKSVFITNCAVCHGQKGEGLIGPNFTDNYWIHGDKPEQMEKIIRNGVPAKGMIPWQGVVSESGISNVIDYIVSLRGTNPPNGKAPEGELITQ